MKRKTLKRWIKIFRIMRNRGVIEKKPNVHESVVYLIIAISNYLYERE